MIQFVCTQCRSGEKLSPTTTPIPPCSNCGGNLVMSLDDFLPNSGEKRTFPSGAWRDNADGKGRYDLLPPAGIRAVAKRFEDGAKKYGDNNWQLGLPMSSFYDSALRHLFKAMAGDTDEDHLAAAAWNVLCAIETRDVLSKKVTSPEPTYCIKPLSGPAITADFGFMMIDGKGLYVCDDTDGIKSPKLFTFDEYVVFVNKHSEYNWRPEHVTDGKYTLKAI